MLIFLISFCISHIIHILHNGNHYKLNFAWCFCKCAMPHNRWRWWESGQWCHIGCPCCYFFSVNMLKSHDVFSKNADDSRLFRVQYSLFLVEWANKSMKMICTFKIIPYLCSCIFHGIRLLRLKSEIGCREITNLFSYPHRK